MLLEDLINTKVKNIKMKKDFGDVPNSDDLIGSNKNLVGSGTAANVTSDKNDPHMVTRTSSRKMLHNKPEKIDPEDGVRYDSYRDYADFIIKNKIAEKNPWFPRIYEMKDFEDASSNHLQKYKLEKLEEMFTLSKKECITICEKLFPYYVENLESRWEYLTEGLAYMLRTLITKEPNKLTEDETLLDAKAILHQFAEEYNAKLNDIGDNNIMVRRGPYGVQLVFTDPTF